MPKPSPRTDSWPDILKAIEAAVDLEATARETKAFLRPRAVKSPQDLLRLALMYASTEGLSLRGVAAEAGLLDIADLSDVALLNRLRNSGDWLALVLDRLLGARAGLADDGQAREFRLALVDGSTVSGPGAAGSDWRLHARYEPAAGRFTDLVLSDARQAESLSRVAVRPGDVMVCDRGYARVHNFTAVHDAGARFITRIGWCALKLSDALGQAFDPLAHLPAQGESLVAHDVRIASKANASPARLIIQRIPPEMVERQHARLRRKQSRKGCKTDPRTRLAAGFLMVVTSLPAELASAERVVALYRLRWQVELAFKRLKSIGGLDDLPATDPKLARTWLLAKLITAVLTEDLARQVLDSPP